MSIKGLLYRSFMKFAHRHNWHYAPPVYPNGDTQLWCQWCGFRETIKKGKPFVGSIESMPVCESK